MLLLLILLQETMHMSIIGLKKLRVRLAKVTIDFPLDLPFKFVEEFRHVAQVMPQCNLTVPTGVI